MSNQTEETRVSRYRCWCGSNAERVDPSCKALMAEAWYVGVKDYDAALEKITQLTRELHNATQALHLANAQREDFRERKAVYRDLLKRIDDCLEPHAHAGVSRDPEDLQVKAGHSQDFWCALICVRTMLSGKGTFPYPTSRAIDEGYSDACGALDP